MKIDDGSKKFDNRFTIKYIILRTSSLSLNLSGKNLWFGFTYLSG